MATLSGAAIDRFLHKPDPAVLAALIHGPDSGGVRERASAIVRAVAGSLDDAFAVVRLSDEVLAGDPARLADEQASLSLMGGRRVIWITEAGGAFLKAVTPILAGSRPGNLIVAEAGNLQKKSPLRTLFESSGSAVAIACYADGAREIDALIAAEMRAAKLSIDDDAREHLGGLLGADRALSRQELAKLATYAHGTGRVTLADVEAVCGDAAEHTLDDLVDAVFEGDLETADSVYQTLLESGTAPDRMIAVANQHAARLASMRIQADGGRRSEDVVRGIRPPIFFSRQAGMVRQLGAWDLEGLAAAGNALGAATRQMRGEPGPAEAIAHRCLLALARRARGTRLRFG
ncbi:MAG: DNA polymerase III subunit delta [Rhizobiales bacterium]|nr:DNA polymerase III subunit delta [Hyphomicrobiales bacterium]